MKYTFQHYIDIQTSASSLTLFQVQAGGEYALQRVKHLLGAYKYIRLGRVSIKLLPASTLPVDPLGLSYDASDPQTVDPRDQMNPGLVRITNGEDILTDFSGLNPAQQEEMYINTMLDPRWSKFMLQSGFKRSAIPLYYTIGQLAQDPYPGAVVNLPGTQSLWDNGIGQTTAAQYRDTNATGTDVAFTSTTSATFNRQFSDPRGFFQTGHRGRMSWMPTDAFYKYSHSVSSDNSSYVEEYEPMLMPLPEVNVITCLLPKAHKTVYYYRCFITETVYLSGLKNTGIGVDYNNIHSEFRAIDNFVRVPFPTPVEPYSGVALQHPVPRTMNDGGGEE